MEKVVLLHGIARTCRSMAGMARYLERQGFEVLNPGYPSTRLSIDQIVATIHPAIHAFAGDGPVHMVGYSMGGLVARAYLARYPIAGRVVLVGTPNQGSEVADFLRDWKLYRWLYGPAGQQLVTDFAERDALFGVPAYRLGVIAGTRSFAPLSSAIIGRPNDGKVAVEATKLEGMHAHLTLPVPHTLMPHNRRIWREVAAFLRDGAFAAPV